MREEGLEPSRISPQGPKPCAPARQCQAWKAGLPVPPSSHFQKIVPHAGIEPARDLSQGILSPQCLPVPPTRRLQIKLFFCSKTIER